MGASQEAGEKVWHISSRHARGRAQEITALVDQLNRAEEELVQLLARWVHEYRGGRTKPDSIRRYMQAFANQQRSTLLPLKKQLIKKAKRL